MLAKRRTRVGSIEDVRDPVYQQKINWDHDATRLSMTRQQLEDAYYGATNPSLPSSEVEGMTEFWLMSSRWLGSVVAIRAALASNPANTLQGLMRLYLEFPALVRENLALPLLVLETPNSVRIQRAMSEPIYALYQQMEYLFNSDGRQPPSIAVTDRIRALLADGYTEDDIQGLQTILKADPAYYRNRSSSHMDFLWGYWTWVAEWNAAKPVPGEPGMVIAYTIGVREKLKTLQDRMDDLLPEMTYNTGDMPIFHSVVNSPRGRFPIVFCREQAAKLELPCVRKRLNLKGHAVGVIPIKVRLDEVQSLVNLGGITAACDGYDHRYSHGALRQLLTAERLQFPSSKAKRSPKAKVGGVQVMLGLVAEIKTNMPDADFWLVRKGSESTIGTPTRTFNKGHIGIRVTRQDLLVPSYLFYVMQFLQQQGYWKYRNTGILNLKSIRVEDVKNIKFSM